jgi:hypothetical protein
MFRRMIFSLSVTGAVIALGASSATALDCANLSRPVPAQASPVLVVPGGPTIWVVQGDWWFVSFDGVFADGICDKVPPGTAATVLGMTADQAASLGFPAGTIDGNYQGGAGFGLLDNAQAPCNANRQTSHGIQAESERCS